MISKEVKRIIEECKYSIDQSDMLTIIKEYIRAKKNIEVDIEINRFNPIVEISLLNKAYDKALEYFSKELIKMQ